MRRDSDPRVNGEGRNSGDFFSASSLLSSLELRDTKVWVPVPHPVIRNLKSDTLPKIRSLKPEVPHQKRRQCPCSALKHPPNGHFTKLLPPRPSPTTKTPTIWFNPLRYTIFPQPKTQTRFFIDDGGFTFGVHPYPATVYDPSGFPKP